MFRWIISDENPMVIAEACESDCEKLKGSTYYFFVEKLGHLDSQL